MITTTNTQNAFLIHVSAFSCFFIPLGSILGPLLVWKLQNKPDELIDEHGKEAVNFNMTYAFYSLLIGIALFFSMLPNLNELIENQMDFHWTFETNNLFELLLKATGFSFAFGILKLIQYLFIIIASIKAKNGEKFSYPLTIKFVS